MKTTSLLTLLLLSGCASTTQWIDTHPKTTAFIAASVFASTVIALESRGHGPVKSEPRMSVPLVPNCSVYPELCK